MKKFECRSCMQGGAKGPCVLSLEQNNADRLPDVCPFSKDGKCSWHVIPVVKKDLTTAEPDPLPKLTAELFNHPDCPVWAMCAAVDKYGEAYWYDSRPTNKGEPIWYGPEEYKTIPGKWDASDWKNSLIRRPEAKPQLPDWCKVWAWVKITDGGVWDGRCRQVLSIDEEKGIVLRQSSLVFSLVGAAENLRPVRIRPWTFEEAPLMFKLLYQGEKAAALLHTCCSEAWEYILYIEDSDMITATLEDIAEHGVQLDGSPCGVPEAGK